MNGDTDTNPMQVALDKLATALVGSEFRRALNAGPAAAVVERAGITVDDLPGGLVEALGAMTVNELRIVALVQQSLKGAVTSDPMKIAILF